MNEVNLGELLLRMIVSLAVVLGLIGIAYAVIKRRRSASFGAAPRRSLAKAGLGSLLAAGRSAGSGARPAAASNSNRAARAAATKRGLHIVGRVGLSRTSSVVAVQFAERVFMLGASETGAPVVLADVGVEEWTDATTVTATDEVPIVRAGALLPDSDESARKSVIEALREATTRRG